jgi:hypothetical protein
MNEELTMDDLAMLLGSLKDSLVQPIKLTREKLEYFKKHCPEEYKSYVLSNQCKVLED